MNKIRCIATREFVSTAGTRSYIMGVVMTPLLLAFMLFVAPRLMIPEGPRTPSTAISADTASQAPAISHTVNAEVTAPDREKLIRGLNRALPFVLLAFLLFGVFIGGGSVMTTTIAEKSNRVMEVLLSAVSPLELMAGKILGQLAASGIVLALYVGLGMAMLASFASLGWIDPLLLVYLFLFFISTYLVVGSLMAAVGAAVNDLRDAQALLRPLTLLLMTPWLLAAPIVRNPESTLSVVLSFVPPVNSFAMLLRLTSSSPPPGWQVWVTIAISLASACAAIWFAARVFRIALLLQGKPPNLATLIRWARAA